jgi:hypothetical protein
VATKRKVKEFEYRFAHLLVDYSGRIRRCPECQRIYLAIRVDQIYCGPRCQTRVATRKWRESITKQTNERRAAVARKEGKDRGITQRKGREGWWVRVYVDGRERWYRCDTKSAGQSLVWTC